MPLKRINYATGADKSNLAAKSEVDKLDTKELVNVPAGLNNLKTKVDGFDFGKLKTVLVVLQKLSNVVSKEVAKNTKFNTL